MVHTLNSSNIFRSWTVKKGKARVCGRSLAGIVGSNPAGGIDVSLLSVVCYQVERGLCVRLSLFQRILPTVVCLSGIVKPRQ
jgi:hypothetical protein